MVYGEHYLGATMMSYITFFVRHISRSSSVELEHTLLCISHANKGRLGIQASSMNYLSCTYCKHILFLIPSADIVGKCYIMDFHGFKYESCTRSQNLPIWTV